MSAITKLWVKKLEDKSKLWNDVPESRKEDVKIVLAEDVEFGKITEAEYESITGESL